MCNSYTISIFTILFVYTDDSSMLQNGDKLGSNKYALLDFCFPKLSPFLLVMKSSN